MKRITACALLLVLLFLLVGCDTVHTYSLDIAIKNENISVLVDGVEHDTYQLADRYFNHAMMANYSNIDFDSYEEDLYVQKYVFSLKADASDTYNISLKLIDANKHVVDMVRIAIIIDGQVNVYKHNDLLERIYHEENDPDSIIAFKSMQVVFEDIALYIEGGEVKEIAVFVWIEEAECYYITGRRRTGWADHSHDATPVELLMEIK